MKNLTFSFLSVFLLISIFISPVIGQDASGLTIDGVTDEQKAILHGVVDAVLNPIGA